MPKTPLRFSTGAPTPLFLPLYVLMHHQGFHLQRDYSIEVNHPNNTEKDGDSWAVNELLKESVDFALCDPIVAEQYGRVRIVATLVRRMAFWAVARSRIQYFKEFEDFKKLISYPRGMTGNLVARTIRKKVSNQRQQVVPVAIGEELPALLDSKTTAVALTTDLLQAKRFVDKHPEFHISPLWNLDPAFSSFMLTGLLARAEFVNQQHPLVKNVVQGFHRAVALAMTNIDEGVGALQAELDKSLAEDEARDFVGDVTRSLLYPISLRPELSYWHNVRTVHIEGGGERNTVSRVKKNIPSRQTFEDSVHTDIPVEVELQSMSVYVRFGKGDLYRELSQIVDIDSPISIRSKSVVGAYSRFDETQRKYLEGEVQKIRQAVTTNSKAKENYLIWGSSGSGKSYLIEELGRTLEASKSCRFEKIDFASHTREQIENAFASIESETRPVLCLLDEVDTTSDLTNDYSSWFSKLRWRKNTGKQIVFVLVGSTTTSATELAKEIEARKKGPDLMRFVPDKHRIDIPDYKPWDRLIIFISTAAHKKKGQRLDSIEKLALYYVAVSRPTEKASGLSDLAEAAIGRMSEDSSELQYKDLFDGSVGDQELFHTFYAEHFSNAQRLAGRSVKLID